jgi:hypothetical protein
MVALSEEVKFSPYSRRKLTSTAASNTSTAPQTRKSRKQTSEVTAETLFSDSRYRSALEKLEASYQKNGDPVKAPQMRKYMKDQFDYYGLQSPGKDFFRMWRSSWTYCTSEHYNIYMSSSHMQYGGKLTLRFARACHLILSPRTWSNSYELAG